MIKESQVLIKINNRNCQYYRSIGYTICDDREILVSTSDVPKTSSIKITALCKFCNSENNITISKYYVNYNRNDKGYYSCFKCKNIEKEKTCLEKYGVKSFSQTDEYKVSESAKWKGIQKGSEKGKKTMLARYGVDSYFKTDDMRNRNREWMSSDEFKQKSKETMLDKFGVDHYSKTDDFKNWITQNKHSISEKMKETFLKKYGVEYYSQTDEWKKNYNSNIKQIRAKIMNTCLEKYGVDNVSKVEDIMRKILDTKDSKNIRISDELISKWEVYKRQVRQITKRNKKELYEKWDGLDYYDSELIRGYLSYNHVHRFYPTIDHKISTFFGFSNDISPEEIGALANLCITKRYINCEKTFRTDTEFLNS